MLEKLTPGFEIMTNSGNLIKVEEHLGEGGQGDVYKVSYKGEKKALKWYKPGGMGKDPQAFYKNLTENEAKGSPSPEFLWMEAVTEWKDGTFGYIMDLRPEGYYDISEFTLRHVQFSSFRTVVDAALRIVSAFRILHNNGYSYQDLNDGNFFINPRNGKVLICDNDNVAPDGVHTGILGKPRYMAPEIVIGRGKNMPNNLSDRYSMSLLLYMIFCLNHPLEGVKAKAICLTPELQDKLYGEEAVFIMDPQNVDNKPDPVLNKNSIMIWRCLPEYIRELFLKAFSQKALKNPSSRPAEIEWIKAFVRFRSEILPCSCGNEVFTSQGASCTCEQCGRNLNIPYVLAYGDYKVPALGDSRIYRCQVGTCNAEDALNPVGNIVRDGDKLKIKNLSNRSWNATTPSGVGKKVAPGEMIPLKSGITFTVNDTTIQIKENA